MVWLYSFFIRLYLLGICLAALRLPKAKAWIAGRRNWLEKLRADSTIQQFNDSAQPVIWLHAASLGEFEQGRPVLEELRKKHANCRIVLTFFSPSGYEVRKDWDGADIICYLPIDSAKNAADLIHLIRPSLAVFVKYEFWYHYLAALSAGKIPTILVSAAFRQGQPFFKWWGGLWRKMLGFYDAIFVQDETSAALIKPFVKEIHIAGDTRYDRVSEIAAAAKSFPEIETWRDGNKIIIAGSTWPEDERLLSKLISHWPPDWKLVIAPHKIDEAHLSSIEAMFENNCVRHSALQQLSPSTTQSFKAPVLLIDNIGMLSSLYRYGDIAWIGGGFNRGGIHNTLEAAVFGLPVIMGPVYQKFVEAVTLAGKGFAFTVTDEDTAGQAVKHLMDDATRESLQRQIKIFVQQQTGATGEIIKWIANRIPALSPKTEVRG